MTRLRKRDDAPMSDTAILNKALDLKRSIENSTFPDDVGGSSVALEQANKRRQELYAEGNAIFSAAKARSIAALSRSSATSELRHSLKELIQHNPELLGDLDS